MKQKYRIRYGKTILFKPLLFLLIMPILSWLLWPDKPDSIVIVATLALAYILPILYLNYQYWRNDVDQIVAVDTSQGVVKIMKGTQTFQFLIDDVVACDFVNVRPFQKIHREYAYLRIKTANETFIITHLTVKPEELLGQLGIPYEDIEVFFPSLNYERLSPKQKEKNQAYFERKKREFLDRYSGFQSIELEDIIKNRGQYADYAVAAAYETLSNRRINPVNKAQA
ncbi:hypothetical protein POKO110462_22960 [Pontibacter korlensis]|uniref:PH domain-containing protein n=1 Tax=Pontibacter korlensis TaxID=400092 RepID=A0A0E3ZJ44_9BACT|nr:hypothetical protein [Pontibacter korlensis]AKD05403.1 hypothetical protein PKOR_23160 [Pontibacter korlensis]